MICRKSILFLPDADKLLGLEQQRTDLIKRSRKVHLLHLLPSQSTQTPVGDQLPHFIEFYFLFKIIGIDHVILFVSYGIRMFILQNYNFMATKAS
ncbi:hypothetical protein SDC9_185048 [bioreactor metagenome]|uniref:Uncharacterized protein n=1 Tax=bioreactor metagenome TaxID=1076179 RepID=A0A645HER3_9ZZZZ